MLSLRTEGFDKAQGRLRQVGQQISRQTKGGGEVAKEGLYLQRAWVAHVSGGPYKAVRTGRYKGSINMRVSAGVDMVQVVVGTNVEYAIYRPSLLGYLATKRENLPKSQARLAGLMRRIGGGL